MSGPPARKLDEAQVRDIRRRYNGWRSAQALSAEYGTTMENVRKIAVRDTWRQLPAAEDEWLKPGDPVTAVADHKNGKRRAKRGSAGDRAIAETGETPQAGSIEREPGRKANARESSIGTPA